MKTQMGGATLSKSFTNGFRISNLAAILSSKGDCQIGQIKARKWAQTEGVRSPQELSRAIDFLTADDRAEHSYGLRLSVVIELDKISALAG